MYNGCILRYGIIIFHRNENHRYLKSNTGLQVFFIPNLVKRSQALVNYSEKPNTCEVIVRFCEVIVRLNRAKLPWNRAIISSLMYQGLDYQIIDVIQLNRAKFIFNRAEKKKPNTYEGVRPFPTSQRTTTLMIYK